MKDQKINRAWHEKHKVPMPSTLEDRIAWHVAHLKHCRCRKDVPATVVAAMKKEGLAVCSRGHVYNLPGPCPTCWPGRLKKRTKK